MITKQKVLIVDDEVKIVEVIKSYLEIAGYQVYEAYNGIQALEVFENVNPSIVILDLMLPDISGEEVCITFRKKTDIPIIILSAKIEDDLNLKNFDIGANDYVKKPFSPRDLVTRIKAFSTEKMNDTFISGQLFYTNDGLCT